MAGEKFRKLTKSDLRGMQKDLQALILEAMDDGLLGKRTMKGHIMLLNPENGKTALLASTPSEYRGLKNGRADIRRMKRDDD